VRRGKRGCAFQNAPDLTPDLDRSLISMNVVHPDPIWLILPLLAVAFFLWVLWNFWQDDRKQRKNDRAAQPKLLVSSRSQNGSQDRTAFDTASRDARGTGQRADAPLQRAVRY
jgi:hypothetical protein